MQVGIPYELVTPVGTLAFNGSVPTLRIERVGGLDFPTIRPVAFPRALVDGDILPPTFRGARYITLEGTLQANSVANRDTLQDSLRQHLNSIVRANATLRWQRRPSATWRRATVRLWEPPQISPEGHQGRFQFQLIAPDPYVYNDTETTHTDTSPTTSSVVANAGDAESFPKVRVHGNATTPTTAFTVRNTTTNAQIRVISLLSTDLDTTGEYIEFDMAARTVKHSSGATRLANMAVAQSSFWPLVPGNNSIVVESITGGTPNQFVVIYRDAWIGG